jgi:hypothetical protein
MKTRVVILNLFVLLMFVNASDASAQNRPQDRDGQLRERRQRRAAQLQQNRPNAERIAKRIKQLQVWKMTDKLKLSEEQSVKFFPKYNRYQDELTDELQNLQAKISRLETVQQSDAKDGEIDAQIEEVLSKRKAVSDVLPKYVREFREVLTARQMADLIIFERDFLRDITELIEQARKRDGLAGEKDIE